jgi:putative nucleotidyltransferase with HDIG domain
MNEKNLIELIEEAIASGSVALPVYPAIVGQLRAALADPKCSAETVSRQIVQDPGLASRILRMANSPFYAGLNKAATMKDAVIRLGFATVVQIATLVAQKENFDPRNPRLEKYFDKLWRHSVACALGSEWLAKRLGVLNSAGEAFMGGLFHDIGKLLLLKCIEDILRGNRSLNFPEELILEMLDLLHEEKGYMLLKAWNLPEIYCEIARTHHREITASTPASVLIVRVADLMAQKLGLALRPKPDLMVSAAEEVARLNISPIALAELEIALEDSQALAL